MATVQSDRSTMPPPNRDNRSLVDLIKELRDEGTMLLRQEVALAKQEIGEKVSRIGRNVAYLAVGGLVLYAGLIFLLLAGAGAVAVGLTAAGLGTDVTAWLAPLIVGLLVGIVGAGLVMKAINTLKHERPVPDRTVQSLKENKEWLQRKIQ